MSGPTESAFFSDMANRRFDPDAVLDLSRGERRW
jgi:hypothetical protein